MEVVNGVLYTLLLKWSGFTTQIIKDSYMFERAYLINLDRRKDRLIRSETHLQQMGLKAERFSAFEFSGEVHCPILDLPISKILHQYLGEYGCYRSHLAVLKKAREQNLKNVIILEDDFCPCHWELAPKIFE